MGANYKDGSVGSMALDGTEPEIQASMLIALPAVPQ